MERIQFRCPNCSKALAIDPKHAGKQVACPGCSTPVTIPDESGATPSPLQAAPTAASSEPATPQNPFAFDAPESTPTVQSPSPYSTAIPAQNAATHAAAAPTASQTSTGKSIGGLVVAMVVAGIFTVVWLIVVSISGYELGILAWGMGGAVGLVAGLIGRNPSPVYCGLTAAIAVMSVLAAKGIMVAALMALGWGADFAMDLADFADLTPERQKLLGVTADQMLVDGEFAGVEKEYAENYVTSYFTGGDLYEEITDEMYEVSEQVEERIQSQLEMKTPEEQEQLILAAKERHPEWIEDHNQYLAALDAMQKEEGLLSDEQAAHAKYESAVLDNDWDDEYYEATSAEELTKRQIELRKIAAERIDNLDDLQRDKAIRDSLQQHVSWNPFPDAHNALLAKMNQEGAFTGPLAVHAKATVEYEMTDGYPDYFDEISEDEMETNDNQLMKAVNEKLVSLDMAARDSLITEMRSQYPDWQRQDLTPEEAQQQLQEVFDEIGTDGTLKGSFLAVFSLLDLLWLFLGATTAYGTALKYGTNEQPG
ncbi:MAG: hypothetical protein H8E66_19865 [Planctomycetes bacterium]|nr:hypothetical protein [Planctomycetota bacterium]